MIPTNKLWGVFNSLAALLIGGSGYVGVWLATDVRWYIDLETATVQNGTLDVIVVRDIHQDFEGGYEVTIRDADRRYVVCTTGRMPVDYQRNAELPEPVTLSYWAYGGKCSEVLADGLPPGRYLMQTCHIVNRPLGIFPEKKRCVWSPPFEVTE